MSFLSSIKSKLIMINSVAIAVLLAVIAFMRQGAKNTELKKQNEELKNEKSAHDVQKTLSDSNAELSDARIIERLRKRYTRKR